MKKNLLAAVLALASSAGPLLAHGGGTDANGCHTNRKTGDFHCHGGRAPAAAPITRLQPSAPPAEPPVIRRATPQEIQKPRQIPPSFLPAPPPKTPEYILEVPQPVRPPGEGFDVIRPKPSELIHLAQLLLRAQKYEIADPPGELGYSTVLAIRGFQSRYHSKPDGRVTPDLLLRLVEAAPAGCL